MISNLCTKIKQEVKELLAEYTALELQSETEPDATLPALLKKMTAVAQNLAAKQQELANCLGIVPAPVPLKPITIGVSRIHCYTETSGFGSDEPYILALAVDLTSHLSISVGGTSVQIPLPSLHVTRVGPWDDVDNGETRWAGELARADARPFWDATGNLKFIAVPSDVILLIALMENDDANPDSVRTTVEGILTGTLHSNPGRTRAQLVNAMVIGMNSAIDTARGAGSTFPFNFDDQIGSTQELLLTSVELAQASQLDKIERTLQFAGDDAKYDVIFTISSSELF